MKKYLTETEKYEKWKKEFHDEIETLFIDIFKKKLDAFAISIIQVDKWNIYFKVTGLSTELERLHAMLSERDILQTVEYSSISDYAGAYKYKLSAPTREDLNAKLGYLRMILY